MSTGISYTNGYAPSEQMALSYDKFGPWTDFYALGATLYKLLTNQNPPSVTDLSEDESEDKHIALPMPNFSNEMKKLVVWMMQVNRLKRPKNVGEILIILGDRTILSAGNNVAIIKSSGDLNDNREETILLEHKTDANSGIEMKGKSQNGYDWLYCCSVFFVLFFLIILIALIVVCIHG